VLGRYSSLSRSEITISPLRYGSERLDASANLESEACALTAPTVRIRMLVTRKMSKLLLIDIFLLTFSLMIAMK
jgi:hypothetical protein